MKNICRASGDRAGKRVVVRLLGFEGCGWLGMGGACLFFGFNALNKGEVGKKMVVSVPLKPEYPYFCNPKARFWVEFQVIPP